MKNRFWSTRDFLQKSVENQQMNLILSVSGLRQLLQWLPIGLSQADHDCWTLYSGSQLREIQTAL